MLLSVSYQNAIMRKLCLIISSFILSAGAYAQSAVVEEEFSVVNPLDSTELHGTLSMPSGMKPKAVIVMATGSGLQDRDETIGHHKPFREIASYLASNGYAVARTDDRGYGDPIDTLLVKRSSMWDELADYRSVMKSMHNRKGFERLPVGMLGHSQGGSEAIAAFSASSKVRTYNDVGRTPDFIITLAAPAVAGDSIILDQTRQILRLQGAEYAYDMYKDMLSKHYSWAKSYIPESSLRAALLEDIKSTMPPGTVINEEMQAVIDEQIDGFCSPAYREMLRYSPAQDITNVNVPWLALYGSKDVQVSVPLNSDALKSATEGKDNVTVTVLVDKNHLFQNAVTGAIEEYQTINGAISDDVLQEILEWLEINFNKKNK